MNGEVKNDIIATIAIPNDVVKIRKAREKNLDIDLNIVFINDSEASLAPLEKTISERSEIFPSAISRVSD